MQEARSSGRSFSRGRILCNAYANNSDINININGVDGGDEVDGVDGGDGGDGGEGECDL